MSTTDIGKNAESLVSDYFSQKGHKVLVHNWRTRWCEIDIITTHNGIAYFIEVKYRKTSTWGDGLDAITSKKQQQMQFAAELWVQQNEWRNDYRLMAVSVYGTPPKIDKIIEL